MNCRISLVCLAFDFYWQQH